MSRVVTITLNPAIDLSIGVDVLSPGTVHRAERTTTRCGGKGHNVAEVLAAHGHAVTAAGFLGAANADRFVAAFAACGIVDGCTRIAGETRTNVKIGEADGRVTDLNTAGAGIDDEAWARLLADVDDLLSAAPAAVVVSGSLAPGVSPHAFAGLVLRITARGTPVWLDTSGAALAAGIAAGPTLVKPNEAELAEWDGHTPASRDELLAAARRMQAGGAADVVISRGDDALLWVTPAAVWQAEPPRVRVIDTVCAGDTLLAGLLHGRLSGWADARTLAFAAALAADAVTRVGVGRSDHAGFTALHTATRIHNLSDSTAVDAVRGGRA
ncbi:1-phosphofructokinase family hexose kinase [Salinisphaera sp. Q1T1-3]|uniref:1-phosphofructokinase family hexose kinase n=1 Tax=Salinisphaera sp. Q1T1-3 TaxID=2321229 RepID=UPI000E71FC5B|nr:1-phosphofructokinase family hexose kinase [Salinisphaera sp. Q1T1-3]RJS94139.1 1-phosphofructokinase family hexose kinase [Salinisphaera sp. Q1T1-3]